MNRERPILFNGEMVRAILEGRKTQTRRVVKGENHCEYHDSRNGVWNLRDDGLWWYTAVHGWADNGLKCPYGKSGDELWVRETMKTKLLGQGRWRVSYAADGGGVNLHAEDPAAGDKPIYIGKSRPTIPSIHMPRWASRIQLRVKDIRVERLCSITEDDCVAEGLKLLQGGVEVEYRTLWDSINAKRGFGWDINPWVWVVEFENIGTNHE